MSESGSDTEVDISMPVPVPSSRPAVASKNIKRLKGSDKVPGRGRGRPPTQEGDGKRRKKPKESFGRYIYQVLKQVHQDISITTSAMNIMNSMIYDIMERISSESSRLLALNKRRTLSSRDIQTAVRLIMGGELGKHAVSEGTKAIAMYNKNSDDDKRVG